MVDVVYWVLIYQFNLVNLVSKSFTANKFKLISAIISVIQRPANGVIPNYFTVKHKTD
jgi:hypothetical protein